MWDVALPKPLLRSLNWKKNHKVVKGTIVVCGELGMDKRHSQSTLPIPQTLPSTCILFPLSFFYISFKSHFLKCFHKYLTHAHQIINKQKHTFSDISHYFFTHYFAWNINKKTHHFVMSFKKLSMVLFSCNCK